MTVLFRELQKSAEGKAKAISMHKDVKNIQNYEYNMLTSKPVYVVGGESGSAFVIVASCFIGRHCPWPEQSSGHFIL